MAHRHVANRPGAGRLRPPFDTADDPEPVRIDR